MTDNEVQVCYEEGFTKHGPGAVVILRAGVWRYEPIAQLGRFRSVKIDEPFFSSSIETKSTTLLDLIDEVAPNYFFLVREVCPPPWLRRLFSRLLRQLGLEKREVLIRVIPRWNPENQDSKVPGTNDFSTEGNEESASHYSAKWQRWLDEVDQLEPKPSGAEPDEYGKALLEKYKQQGLELN